MTTDQIAQLDRLIAAGIELSNVADFIRKLPSGEFVSQLVRRRAGVARDSWDKELKATAELRSALRGASAP
jgi:hypothetical protein